MPDPANEPVLGRADRPTAGATTLVLALVASALLALRLAGPSDLMDNDQLRPAMYALDAVRNGHWLCQSDPTGDITSKPPLYTWAIAVLSTLTGRVDRLSLYLPCAAAMFGAAAVASRFASAAAGGWAGLLAGVCLLCSSYGLKHVALARTDAVFCFMVSLGALCAWRAWRTGGGWVWFWLAAAGATLTKGPLGLPLAGAGLLAVLWERRSAGRSERARVKARAAWWPGAALYVLICGGWFLAAYIQRGQPLIDKMIGRELIGHAVESSSGAFPGKEFYKPLLYYLSRFLPWSPLTFMAILRVCRRPAADAEGRASERFLVCWFVAGLAVFSLATHQRADLLLPLVPAGAALGAIELARLMRGTSARVRISLVAIAVAGSLLGGYLWHHLGRASDRSVLETDAVALLAARLGEDPLRGLELVDVDATFALQYFMGSARPRVPSTVALDRIASGEDVLIATKDPAGLAGLAFDRGLGIVVLDTAEARGSTVVAIMGKPRTPPR